MILKCTQHGVTVTVTDGKRDYQIDPGRGGACALLRAAHLQAGLVRALDAQGNPTKLTCTAEEVQP